MPFFLCLFKVLDVHGLVGKNIRLIVSYNFHKVFSVNQKLYLLTIFNHCVFIINHQLLLKVILGHFLVARSHLFLCIRKKDHPSRSGFSDSNSIVFIGCFDILS